jgi:hypothetical protein
MLVTKTSRVRSLVEACLLLIAFAFAEVVANADNPIERV